MNVCSQLQMLLGKSIKYMLKYPYDRGCIVSYFYTKPFLVYCFPRRNVTLLENTLLLVTQRQI